AERRLPAVADMQRAGGIRRYELDHDAAAAAHLSPSERLAETVHIAHHRKARAPRQGEVDEARTRDVGAGDRGVASERGDDRLGRFARLAADALCELQRDVRGEVAVIRILRAIQLYGNGRGVGKRAVDGAREQLGEARL